ncbi:BTAD domain-containing putative transcriptional regulator [Albidovulum sediminicola]|uniref:Tetratricopeptide repeat protein n=1 Tax=Albidovulum sediminicola TaxID=2984331 RepID=A0ABT2Z105_9RHOB|nr:BTAD domain-containing putative transcriptional regulator [Defluviimonas sp. WL0075]MCV2864806.1 tetratricopeptide repeat protein [Defluviimonas sp. WL0075]
MRRLRLDLLGGFTLSTSEGVELPLPTRKDRQLLAFLALQGGRAQSRDRLASLLWADRAEPQARSSLRQSLAALRKAFRAAGTDPLAGERVTVTLDLSEFAVDAIDFADGCSGSMLSCDIAELYRGPLLDGIETSTPEFEQWVMAERARLDELAGRLVTTASISVLPEADRGGAMRLGRKLLSQDRSLEAVYRALMRICNARGDRAAALKLYANCRAALREELDVEPDRDTEDLYRDILTGHSGAEPSAAALNPAAMHAIDDRPSIAILPFRNLTGNDRLNFLCEGLAEEIATGLGRFRSVFVIDQYSSAAVAATTSDTAEIARQLGVMLLMQGSIQANAARLRITVRLVEGTSRAQTWSDIFECEAGEALAVPDQIARAIIVTIQNRMEDTVAEQSRKNPSPAACECALRGIKHLRGYAPDDNDKAIALFREALRLDPDHALAQAYLAFAEIVMNNYDAAPRPLLLDCKARIERALERDPEDGRIRWVLASVHGYLREFDEERHHIERALQINPNDANARMTYGAILADSGQPEEGIAMIREAMRLNPFHPEWYWLLLGDAFLSARRYEDAIEAYKRRTNLKVWSLSRLASCYAHLGRDAEAQDVKRRILEKDPNFRISSLRRGAWSERVIEDWKAGMRKAGLPE